MKMPHLSPLLKSMFMAFIGFSAWAWSDAVVHYLQDYPVILVAFVADAFAVLFLCLFASYLGGFRDTFHLPRLKMRMFRGALLAISGLLAFIAFSELELTKAYAIIFLAPLLIKILSVIIMKEHIRPRSWAISALGFVGVMVVLRPGYVSLDIGSAAALGLAVFFSISYVLSRYIGEENQTPLSMALFQNVFVTMALAYPAINLLQDINLGWQPIALMAAVGFGAAVGSVLVARSFARAPSAYIAPIHYTQILWGALLGTVFFKEYPDIWTVIGGTIIVVSGLLLIKFSRKV